MRLESTLISKSNVQYSTTLASLSITCRLPSPRPLRHNHLVAVLMALGARLACTSTLAEPAPDGAWLLVTLGFTTTTSMRMITSIWHRALEKYNLEAQYCVPIHCHTTNSWTAAEPATSAGLPQIFVFPERIADLADSCDTVLQNLTHFSTLQPYVRIFSFWLMGDESGKCTS